MDVPCGRCLGVKFVALVGTPVCGAGLSRGVPFRLGSVSAIELVADEGVHPISEHCTRSDRV